MIWFWRKRTDVWLDGFKEGFRKGIDMKSDDMRDLVNKVEEDSIKRAVERLRKKPHA